MVVTFRTNHLLAVNRLAQDGAHTAFNRPYLHNWCVDFAPGRGAWAVATNGVVLLAAPAIDNTEKSTPDPVAVTYWVIPDLRASKAPTNIDVQNHQLYKGRSRKRTLQTSRIPFPKDWYDKFGKSGKIVPVDKADQKGKFTFDPLLLVPIVSALSAGKSLRTSTTIRFMKGRHSAQYISFSGAENADLICRMMLCDDKRGD